LREHGMLAGVFSFGGDDDEFHGTFNFSRLGWLG
jgi:hypothetical protein